VNQVVSVLCGNILYHVIYCPFVYFMYKLLVVSATFWSRIMISRGFEAVNTVFGGYFGFGKKNHVLPENVT
jgi:hypothetical protein